MELKFTSCVNGNLLSLSSNRTFMELKFTSNIAYTFINGSNRTFMELKCGGGASLVAGVLF